MLEVGVEMGVGGGEGEGAVGRALYYVIQEK